MNALFWGEGRWIAVAVIVLIISVLDISLPMKSRGRLVVNWLNFSQLAATAWWRYLQPRPEGTTIRHGPTFSIESTFGSASPGPRFHKTVDAPGLPDRQETFERYP